MSLRPESGLTNKQVLKSLMVHIALVLFFSINAYMFPSEDLKFEDAIRVDIVGLPEKLKKLPEPAKNQEIAKPKAVPVEATKTPAPVVPEKPAPAVDDKKAAELERKKAQAKALEKLQALEALSQMEAEESAKETTKSEATAVAGNVVSQGNALTGIRQNQITSYVSSVKDHVNKNWNLPQWMAAAKLRAEAVVMIDARGVVIRRAIVKTSGNSSFDDSILSAIDSASPFPPPPAALVGVFKNKGFTLGFPE